MPKLRFKKTNYISLSSEEGKQEDSAVQKQEEGQSGEENIPSVPEGMWIKCPACGEMLYKDDVVAGKYICYKCGNYFRVRVKNRIRMVADKKSFEPWFSELPQSNPLNFPGYEEKIDATREKTKIDEAVVIGKAKVNGRELVLGVCDARFLMGSMGYVVGEKITRAFERAITLELPVVLFCCSGGARMQEGMVSLMQMAKTSAAIKKHSEAGLFYMPILTDPTTGGVTASFAMLGDIILAEPGALIGFAGPRVIEQTIGQKLPEGFQRAEFLVEHGIIDGIVTRDEMKDTIARLLDMHGGGNFNGEVKEIKEQKEKHLFFKKQEERTAWERVTLSRKANRPTAKQYIDTIFDDFYELHGDRALHDDGAIIGGIAHLQGRPVTVIGIQKGKTTKENIIRNFGMPSPEGYRKALRLMQQAEKFGRPIINFVDTPGAYCGLEAEERGQGEAIARNLYEMSALKVPVLSILIGEGGSGGALALAVANEVWMLENATYSILSPEGFASILWKDSKLAEKAAGIMKITASDLKKLGIIERIIPETEPAAERNVDALGAYIRYHMIGFLKSCEGKSGEELAEQRYKRFRGM